MDYLFTFETTHYAISAENLLVAEMPVKVMALPSSIGSGCGICLRINELNVEKAKKILKDSAVKVKNIYEISQNDNGKRSYKLWN
ncbi:DUF3343 domain-containing protein [Vagococcus elongatus]|uniref:Putative Se/S carrier protein-like domain-containing protein n=1 Tax=Vagococcus elongatus TaxID=180344 RepID=A0A430AN44_9ENTE|nr:DUF3343 domain-containing protein [Vagococcus elongatus]RSU09344.1 hypothetical protein CBF29_11605 [Vagococcus elongatus]